MMATGNGYPYLISQVANTLAIQKITEKAIQDSGIKKIPANTVIMSFKLSIGKVAITSKEMYSNEAIMAFIDKKRIKLLPEYVYYLLMGVKWDQNTNKAVMGKTLNKSTISQIIVDVDDYEIQKQKAEALDSASKQLDIRNKEIHKLDTLVKARFVEMFEGNNYAKRTLEEVCINIVDCPHSTPKYEGELLYPAIRTTEIKSGYIDWSTMKYVSKDEYIKRTSRLVPEPGDIVYGREGTYGNAVVLPPDIKFCLGQRVMLFRPNTQVCLSEYLLYSILSDSVKQQADAKNVGATVPHVNVADAKKFKILVPPIIKQNEFVYFVHQVDKSKVAIQKFLDEAQTLFDSLMQEYFS